jgi:hypothetical protein
MEFSWNPRRGGLEFHEGFDFAFESFRRTLARRTPVEHSAWGNLKHPEWNRRNFISQ